MLTVEAEYVSLSACSVQVIWMRTQLLDYRFWHNKILMYCDSKSAIGISCNPVQHSRTKHINTRYHFIKEHVEKGTIELYFIGTEYQLADLFTKALPRDRFEYLVHRIAAQLDPKFQSIERCTNYAVLQSIPCSPECKIMGQILLDHPLSYALTAIADVPVLDTQEITYTVDMFRDTLKLPVETLDNLFITPVTIRTIESFMKTVGYQRVVDKVSAFYTKFLAQPWQTMFKKYSSIPQRLDEDYHSIKDDILLVSVYSIGNVLFRGMMIPDALLTNEIRATDDYKEFETVFVALEVPMIQPQPVRKQSAGETSSPRKSLKVTIKQKKHSTTLIPPPSDDRERDKIVEATLLSLTLHKTSLAAEAQENVADLQEKLAEKEIEKMVEGEEDEESYASEFAGFMFNDDDDDDSSTRIEPESHKENPEVVDDDDVTKKKDDKNMKMKRKMRMLRKRMMLLRRKTISEELTATVSPTTATTSKSKSKRGFTSNKTKILPRSIAGMCRRRG
ncbi:hypothetical protein Tco_0401833 [Tanacetum coccineum]